MGGPPTRSGVNINEHWEDYRLQWFKTTGDGSLESFVPQPRVKPRLVHSDSHPLPAKAMAAMARPWVYPLVYPVVFFRVSLWCLWCFLPAAIRSDLETGNSGDSLQTDEARGGHPIGHNQDLSKAYPQQLQVLDTRCDNQDETRNFNDSSCK